jgi:hypothetical protein
MEREETMGMVIASVGLDNYTQAGDQTLAELQQSIQAQTGAPPGIASIIRDPSTGRLVRVELTLPDTAAAQAAAVIAANKGVATTIVAPPQLFLDDLKDTGGIVLATVLEAGVTTPQVVTVLASGNPVGTLTNVGAGNVYTDGGELLSADPARVRFRANGAVPLIIPPADAFVLHMSPTLSLSLVRTGTITLVASSDSSMTFYIATDGRLFLESHHVGGVNQITPRAYADAVQYPAA